MDDMIANNSSPTSDNSNFRYESSIITGTLELVYMF
jgi:hypothetical protein